MAILAFAIGALLLASGFGSLALSVNLVPTEMGLTYAICGVILVGTGGITVAVAALIARIDRISAPRRPSPPPPPEVEEPIVEAPAPETAPPLAEPPEDEEVNFNRSGHLPTLREVEDALVEPEAGPKLVGRYSSGGANYAIYADGTIEAETDEGGYRFASMDEFKNFIANRKR